MTYAGNTLTREHQWCTPRDLLEAIGNFRPIYLDPFANPDSPVWASYYFLLPELAEKRGVVANDQVFLGNCLDVEWNVPADALIFANPPYGRSENPFWARELSSRGEKLRAHAHLIALVPSPTGAKWFRTYNESADAMLFLRKRPKFELPPVLRLPDKDDHAKFDGALFYWGPDVDGFKGSLAHVGWKP